MRIYTRGEFVWDEKLQQYQLKSAEFYDYDGKLALAGGGGQSQPQPQIIQTPPQTTTTIQSNEPWAPQQSYLKTGMAQAKKLFIDQTPGLYPGQMTADFSPQTQGALNAVTQRAINGSPVMGAANQNAMQTLNGDFINNNPTIRGDYLYGGAGFNAAVDAANRKILPAVNSAFNGAGRLHSGLSDVAKTQAMSDSYAGLYNDERARQDAAYQSERENQMRTSALAPSYAQQDYYDAGQLLNAGQMQDQQNQAKINENIYRYNYPAQTQRDQLKDYAAIVGQNYGSTGSNTSTTSGGVQVIPGQYAPQRQNPILQGLQGGAQGLALGMPFGYPALGMGLGLLAGAF
jgi:hypothetical protein